MLKGEVLEHSSEFFLRDVEFRVSQIENDPRGRIRSVGIGLEAARAFEEAQEVGFEALVQHRLVRNGLVKGDDRFRGSAKFGGQARADLLDARRSQLV